MAAKSAEDIFCAMSKLHDGMKSEKPGCTLNGVKRSKDTFQQFFALRLTGRHIVVDGVHPLGNRDPVAGVQR